MPVLALTGIMDGMTSHFFQPFDAQINIFYLLPAIEKMPKSTTKCLYKFYPENIAQILL